MSCFPYENHQGSPTLALLNVLGVLGVLNVLHVLNMPMDVSLACWALFKLKVVLNQSGCNQTLGHFKKRFTSMP